MEILFIWKKEIKKEYKDCKKKNLGTKSKVLMICYMKTENMQRMPLKIFKIHEDLGPLVL